MTDSGRLPPPRWRQADEIFGSALETPSAERAAFVAKACAGDAELMGEVEALLAADAQAGAFLEPPRAPRSVADATDGLSRSSSPALSSGTVLAERYRVEEHLGNGGMGAVYRARDLVLETDVAVKVLTPQLTAPAGRMEAFRREVRLARLVTHPNVCRVHDIVEDGGVVFITMEYVRGESLADRLERCEALPLDECLRLVTDVARGLAAAHAASVIHRDLKPGNVLLRARTQEAVVADFGVAAEAAGPGHGYARGGTRGYMAPEQVAGAPPDVRSDLFALGVLAHRAATGHLPGDGATGRNLPPRLDGLVSACLQNDPSRRPRDAAAVVRLLESVPRASRRRRWVVGAALLAAVALATTLRGPGEEGRRAPASLVLASVDTSELAPEEAWLGDAFQGLVVNDLIDAWSLDARTIPTSSPSGRGTVRTRLWRDAAGLLHAAVFPPGGPFAEAEGGSLHRLAEGAARRIAEGAVPSPARHPTAAELREVGARDPEAWRQFRRAQRASRMEHWARVRALARDAVDRDPTFVRAWLELDLTYNKEDQARQPILDKVIALGDRAQGLSPLSQLAVEFERRSRREDEAGVAEVLRELAALKLEGNDLLYMKTRLALSSFSQGDTETALPVFEWIAEKWPQDAAAPKKLADYYVGDEDPVSLTLALRHGEKAVAFAPEDVAARANLARALLLAGDERGARAHLSVIARADPEEKEAAFLGERTNRLFALHMMLGELEAAAEDARRLVRLSGIPHGQGQTALAAIALARGAFDEGLDGLAASAAHYERLQVDALALWAYWQYAWQAHALGQYARTIAASEHVRGIEPRLHDSLGARYARRTMALGTLARMEAGLLPANAATIRALRAQIDASPAQGEWARWRGLLDLLISHRLRDWDGVVAAYREMERTAAPLAVTWEAADSLEHLGRAEEAARLYERLATHPNAWQQPYRRGQAWLRLGRLRDQRGDTEGARMSFASLLRLWDRARRDRPEVVEAERRSRER